MELLPELVTHSLSKTPPYRNNQERDSISISQCQKQTKQNRTKDLTDDCLRAEYGVKHKGFFKKTLPVSIHGVLCEHEKLFSGRNDLLICKK